MSDPIQAYSVLPAGSAGTAFGRSAYSRTPALAHGDVVRLARTNPRHIAGFGERAAAPAGPEKAFGDLLAGALGSVNDAQLRSMDLTQQMIANPDSVNVHDVTIALAEANLALSMTKSIVDRALTAYREIINIR